MFRENQEINLDYVQFNDSPIMKSISTDLKESNFIITSHENNDSSTIV